MSLATPGRSRAAWRAPQRPRVAETGSHPYFELLAHRARDPPPSSSLAEERRSDQQRLRSLLVMELFDSLFDDETVLRMPESSVPALLARYSELRSTYPSLLAMLVVPDRRLAEI